MNYHKLFLASILIFASLIIANAIVKSTPNFLVGVPVCQLYTEQSGVHCARYFCDTDGAQIANGDTCTPTKPTEQYNFLCENPGNAANCVISDPVKCASSNLGAEFGKICNDGDEETISRYGVTCPVTCTCSAGSQSPKPCNRAIWNINLCIWDSTPCYTSGGCDIEAQEACYANGNSYVWYDSTCTCNFDPGGAGGGCETNPSPSCSGSPIIIDVAGNKFNLTNSENGVLFDLNGDGNRERWSWTSPNSDDAFLVLDRNRNGVIDNGLELFGNFTPQNPAIPVQNRNGFYALAEFDNPNNGGNGDGKITRQDRVFADLRLWQDFNHNGLSEPNEIRTMDALDVRAVFLDFKVAKRKDRYGNLFKYRAKVRDQRDADVGKWAWDVFFLRGN